jgi:hypothetical protein
MGMATLPSHALFPPQINLGVLPCYLIHEESYEPQRPYLHILENSQTWHIASHTTSKHFWITNTPTLAHSQIF